MRHVVPALIIFTIYTSFLLSPAAGLTEMKDIPFTTLAQGHHSGIREPRHVVILDQASWQALLTAMQPFHNAVRPLPAVDFASHMVVGIFLGMRRTGGYNAVINGIVRDPNNGTITVQATETIPPPGTMTIQVLTYPYHLVRVRALPGEVEFLPAVP